MLTSGQRYCLVWMSEVNCLCTQQAFPKSTTLAEAALTRSSTHIMSPGADRASGSAGATCSGSPLGVCCCLSCLNKQPLLADCGLLLSTIYHTSHMDRGREQLNPFVRGDTPGMSCILREWMAGWAKLGALLKDTLELSGAHRGNRSHVVCTCCRLRQACSPHDAADHSAAQLQGYLLCSQPSPADLRPGLEL